MRTIILLTLGLAAVAAVPTNPQRIVGGSVTTINQYPTMAALLFTFNWSTYVQNCGGTILNNRSILTAAHCPVGDPANRWRIRVGSTWGNSGGIVYNVNTYILHPNYNQGSMFNNDVAVMRSSNNIAHSNVVRPVSIAGANYNLGDNQVIWAAGWGSTSFGSPFSEQLRHVQVWSINQNVCVARYAEIRMVVNANMLCTGWLDVGGRDQCQGDSGGPAYHNGIQVGISSWGAQCGAARHPGVNARVSRYTSWIQSNA